jgi:hypothetical protein
MNLSSPMEMWIGSLAARCQSVAQEERNQCGANVPNAAAAA